MRVKLHQNTSGDQFEVGGSCELEATSDGIDILNKIVKLQSLGSEFGVRSCNTTLPEQEEGKERDASTMQKRLDE